MVFSDDIDFSFTKYRIVIVGGGVSGLSAALTLSSGFQKYNLNKQENKILVIDSGHSDAMKAVFFNVPGVAYGTEGYKILTQLKKQIADFGYTEFIDNDVKFVGKRHNNFDIVCKKEENNFSAEILVLATGYKIFEIKFDPKLDIYIDKTKYPYSSKNRIMLKNMNNKITNNLWVCGLVSGVYSQFASASASGVNTALNILAEIKNKFEFLHDKIE